MALGKLRYGFVEVRTGSGPCYVRPKFWERLRLVWIFRNFAMLPQQVLKPSQQRFISSLCEEGRMYHGWGPKEQERAELIGTLISASTSAEDESEKLDLIST